MRFRYLATALAASLVLASGAVSAATLAIGTSDGTIGELDTDTGVVANTFNPGVGSWFDIAINNAGTGYGIANGTTAYTIDHTANSVTLLGATGAAINGLAFGSGGSLFGTGGNGLYSINTSNGSASLVGTGVGGSFSSSGDIAYAGGTTLYGTSSSGCGNLGGDCLWSIDGVTGAGSIIGATGVSQLYGLGLANGTLFGLSSANDLYAINTSTGAATFSKSYAISGSTFGGAVPPSTVTPIPVPASLPLLGFGLAWFGFLAKRKRLQS